MGHECAHAVFFQAGLSIRNQGHPSLINADEMAAQVLGAHISGRVAGRVGWDGQKFRLVTLALFRRMCTNKSIRDSDKHFGPVEVMNGMHGICLESPDIWTAAHRIAAEYFIVDDAGRWVYWDGEELQQ
jgi:hypothetical protein